MHFVTIRYEAQDRIATITLNRPDQLNAASPFMPRELKAEYAAVQADEAVVTAIATGALSGFSRRWPVLHGNLPLCLPRSLRSC